MTGDSLNRFIQKLKEILNQVEVPSDKYEITYANYLDLGHQTKIPFKKLFQEEKIPQDMIAEAFSLIIKYMSHNDLDKIKFGLNELLKSYLKKINHDNQKNCTNMFLPRIISVFLCSLLPSFAFRDLLWQYLCRCLQSCGFYLISQQLTEANHIYSDYVAYMGKTAAREGLPTDKIQHFLRMTEVKALESGNDQLAGHVKNLRHNLEI